MELESFFMMSSNDVEKLPFEREFRSLFRLWILEKNANVIQISLAFSLSLPPSTSFTSAFLWSEHVFKRNKFKSLQHS
jgi:hypothetical protein